MKKRFCFVLLVISTMAGCTHTARLYPVQGPLSSQAPAPVIFGKISGVFYPGNISVVLSDGEVCRGRWAAVEPVQVPKGATTTSVQVTADGMPSVWDTVYGAGFYVSHVLGARYYAQVVASGNRGTIFNVEMYRPRAEGEDVDPISLIRGVARDNKGNIYKLVL